MNIMGSACSMQRQRSFRSGGRRNSNNGGREAVANGGSASERSSLRRSVRHSVVSEIPDDSIASLYPVEDNYVNVSGNRRSPKPLAELCTDALCRSLPYLNGELPPGLPQDVVDDIVHSLIKHSALNATTLRVLRNCELGCLSLAGCRGVSDEWLTPLRSSPVSSTAALLEHHQVEEAAMAPHHHKRRRKIPEIPYAYGPHLDSACRDMEDSSASSSTSSSTSFVSASSTPLEDKLGRHGDGCEHAMASATMLMEQPPPTAHLTLLDLRGSQRLTDKGLMQLTDLSRLEVARLDQCHALVGRGMLAFSSSHRLRSMSLANCRRLTDEAILNISHLVSLEALSVDGCRCLTDRSLAAISGLYELRQLDLSQCDLITDEGLEHLDQLVALEEVSLGWCRSITNDGIQALVEQPGRSTMLRTLRLARCSITDEGVPVLGRLAALEDLDLNGCSGITGATLGTTLQALPKLTNLDVSYCSGILRSSWQGKIPSLKTIELCYSSVRDSHLAKWASLPALEELNLDSCPVGDWAMAHLADNHVTPNLTSLGLADTDLTDAGMVHIGKFSKLTRLSLFYCSITNQGLRHLSQLTELEALNLDSRDISDEGLSHLRPLKKLKALDIFSGRVTDSGCAHLAKITSLESLELCGGGIGDLGCSLLATLDNLTSLNLSQNERISNRGAASLAALSNLKALNLSNTRVNSHALRFLSGLVKLKSLALYGCRGIDDGNSLHALQNELPSLKCLKLNNGASQQDGIVVTDEHDDEDDEVEEEDDQSEAEWDDDDEVISSGVYGGASSSSHRLHMMRRMLSENSMGRDDEHPVHAARAPTQNRIGDDDDDDSEMEDLGARAEDQHSETDDTSFYSLLD